MFFCVYLPNKGVKDMGELSCLFDIIISMIIAILLIACAFYFYNKKIISEFKVRVLEKEKETSNEIQKIAALLNNYKNQATLKYRYKNYEIKL